MFLTSLSSMRITLRRSFSPAFSAVFMSSWSRVNSSIVCSVCRLRGPRGIGPGGGRFPARVGKRLQDFHPYRVSGNLAILLILQRVSRRRTSGGRAAYKTVRAQAESRRIVPYLPFHGEGSDVDAGHRR